MLQLSSISYHVGTRAIFENAGGRVPAGHRVGLVGANGSGKTTLLRLIGGELEPDRGTIHIRRHCTVGTVAQDVPSGSRTALEVVLAADGERQRLLAEADVAVEADQVARVHERLTDIDAHSAPARAAVILAGLGFDEAARIRPMSEFSGGWRMRVALACALFQVPDLLLLDEPTNHLDLESVLWLESHLKQYPGTLLIVSHDQNLLNEVVNGILHVKDGQLAFYSGNYDAFVRAQAEREALEDAMAVKQELARRHLQSFVDRFRAKATKAKQAQSRLKALERMAPVTRTVTRNPFIRFRFPEPAATPSPLVRLIDAAVGYRTDCPVLTGLHFSIFAQDRIALLGANGNGKSTLARLLSGHLPALSGEIVRAQKLVVGYFAQDHLEQLNPSFTAMEQVATAMGDGSAQAVRDWLGRFGLGQERSEVRVGSLSGGEKTRLALSLVTLGRPNLMILDEPTNHLDVDSRRSLMDGLNEFEGAILLISHDRQLIETTCDQLWLVGGGTCRAWSGDMDEYRDLLLSERSAGQRNAAGSDAERTSRRDVRREAAKNRAALAPLRKRLAQIDQVLASAGDEKKALEERMGDPSFYGGDKDNVVRAVTRVKELADIIETAEAEWLEVQEALEQALAEP